MRNRFRKKKLAAKIREYGTMVLAKKKNDL